MMTIYFFVQLEDLCQFRVTLYGDIERIEQIRKRQLLDRVTVLKEQRKELQQKLRYIHAYIINYPHLFMLSRVYFHCVRIVCTNSFFLTC